MWVGSQVVSAVGWFCVKSGGCVRGGEHMQSGLRLGLSKFFLRGNAFQGLPQPKRREILTSSPPDQ